MSSVTHRIDFIHMTSDAHVMTPKTCRAARVLLELGQIELAKRAGIAVQTVRNHEGGETAPSHKTWLAIKAGVQFIDENGAGVRLRRPA
jgi:DNA-binding transcriptional regulator YiaG